MYKRQVYVSGLVLVLISMVIALLGVAVLLTCSLQNGIIQMCIRDRKDGWRTAR